MQTLYDYSALHYMLTVACRCKWGTSFQRGLDVRGERFPLFCVCVGRAAGTCTRGLQHIV